MSVIQTQRGTAAALAATNPVIADGQIVVETDTLRLKIGDGSTAWNSLAYATPAVSHTHTVSQISDLAAGANAAARLYLWQTFR
jgi:F0F1-type ATP synthase alpha subunit